MDESTRERRNRILERLSETRTYLERVRSVIVDKGAVGVAPRPSLLGVRLPSKIAVQLWRTMRLRMLQVVQT